MCITSLHCINNKTALTKLYICNIMMYCPVQSSSVITAMLKATASHYQVVITRKALLSQHHTMNELVISG